MQSYKSCAMTYENKIDIKVRGGIIDFIIFEGLHRLIVIL